ncbi:MAG: insulinase family protein [Armatimonadetes bacterium]|nr:insulinase family protein [Armatimonadota bacterium]
MRPRLAAGALALAAVLFLPPAPGARSAPRPGITRHVLENGLTVIIKEHPISDLVVAFAMIRAGPRVEEAEESGITFFLRSMLVRGTRHRTAAEIAQTIESLGGLLGGGTGYDYVSSSVVVPSRHLDTALDLLADLLTNARFDAQDIETQRRVSLSRISQNADQPLQRAIELFGASLYPYHPYAKSILGTPEAIGALTRERLVEFYRTYFTASNTVLVVAGNIIEAAALEKVKRTFGALPAGSTPRKLRWLRVVERALAPALLAPKETRETRAISAAWIVLGYLGVPVGHRDYAPLRVLNAILGEGFSSRLFTEIRDRRGLAYQIGSSLSVRAGPGPLLLFAGTDPPNLSTVVRGMLREVERLRAEAPPAEEVEKAKRGIIGRYTLAREALESQAFYLAWYEVLGVGYAYDERFPDEVSRVTPPDVLRVAQRYLHTHAVAVVAPATAR